MIYDKLENAGTYKGISANLDKALDFIKNIDFDKLEAGNHKIDGDKVHYIVVDEETVDAETCKYETHDNYIDIQLVATGSQFMRYTPSESPVVTDEYDADKDCAFFKLTEGYDLKLIPGTFALVFPKELHAPKIMSGKHEKLRRVIVKVLA